MPDREWQHAGEIALFWVIRVMAMYFPIAMMMAFIHPDQPLGKHAQPITVLLEPGGGLFADFVILIDLARHAENQDRRFGSRCQRFKGREISFAIFITLAINHLKQNDVAGRCA